MICVPSKRSSIAPARCDLDAGQIIAEGAHGALAVGPIALQIDPRLAVAVTGQAAEEAARSLDAVKRACRRALEAVVRLEDLQFNSALRAHAQAQAGFGKGRRAGSFPTKRASP